MPGPQRTLTIPSRIHVSRNKNGVEAQDRCRDKRAFFHCCMWRDPSSGVGDGDVVGGLFLQWWEMGRLREVMIPCSFVVLGFGAALNMRHEPAIER